MYQNTPLLFEILFSLKYYCKIFKFITISWNGFEFGILLWPSPYPWDCSKSNNKFKKKCPVTVNVNSGGGQKSPKSCLRNLCTAPKYTFQLNNFIHSNCNFIGRCTEYKNTKSQPFLKIQQMNFFIQDFLLVQKYCHW